MSNKYGQEEAARLGYTLMFHSPNHSATYLNEEGIALTVYADETEAELSSQWKLVRLTTGKIGWPHPRLEMFENQIRALLNGVQRENE